MGGPRKRRKFFVHVDPGGGGISEAWPTEGEWEFEAINVHWQFDAIAPDPFQVINIPDLSTSDYDTLLLEFDPFTDGKNGIPVRDWACAGIPFRISAGFGVICANVQDQEIGCTIWIRSVD